eukprot:6189070-Pleurochrysis_carterae.AAC.3
MCLPRVRRLRVCLSLKRADRVVTKARAFEAMRRSMHLLRATPRSSLGTIGGCAARSIYVARRMNQLSAPLSPVFRTLRGPGRVGTGIIELAHSVRTRWREASAYQRGVRAVGRKIRRRI